jgi:hypothetical protein
MHVGFDTIGNATVIAYDGNPILATDPWLQGGAYFGSWRLSHEVPEEQLAAVRACPYIWFSHGHPDHLNGDSLPLLRGKKVLVPDHVGSRILSDLISQGFEVRVLPDRVWTVLSPRIRVLCISDYNQDGVLLLDINGTLVVNINDAGDRGWGTFVRSLIRTYKRSFLLGLAGYGDADMMNVFDEAGVRMPLQPRGRLGQTVSARANWWGTRYCIPFSSMHRFQRADSAWAAAQSAPLSDWKEGWASARCELLPPFVRVDCEKEHVTELNPREDVGPIVKPSEFGDDWSEPLTAEEFEQAKSYFLRFEQLHRTLDHVTLRVGGKDNEIVFNKSRFRRGLRFEAPRGSLVAAVRYEIFDDLLIGNFAKVTLLGSWGEGRLYPDFTPFVAKYGDNGRARTREELERYFRAYRGRDQLGYLRHQFDAHCVRPAQEVASSILRASIGANTPLYRAAKKTWWMLRSI